MRSGLFALAMALLSGVSSASSITNLTSWTLIQDPPHPRMSVQGLTATEARLLAVGEVPSGTDIGFVSVNGDTVATSTAGNFFDPATDFSLAIDFELRLSLNVSGVSAIGFGIGIDASGANSAGVALASLGEGPLFFTAVGRLADADISPKLFSTAPLTTSSIDKQTQGRLFIDYGASSRDVTVGVSRSGGASAPSETRTFPGLAESWGDSPILTSFFLRSDNAVFPFPGLTAGSVGAYFSNFEILRGSPITIPEPATGLLAILGALGVLAVKKRTS